MGLRRRWSGDDARPAASTPRWPPARTGGLTQPAEVAGTRGEQSAAAMFGVGGGVLLLVARDRHGHRRAADHAEQVTDAEPYVLLAIAVGVLRLAVPRRRLDAGGAEAAVSSSASSSSRPHSSGPSSSRPDRRSICSPTAAPKTYVPGWCLPEQLVPVGQFAVHHRCWRRCSRGSGSRWGTRQPASPTKFALGLILVGLGFLILMPAAQIVPRPASRSACRGCSSCI